jgi:hypothetical protein
METQTTKGAWVLEWIRNLGNGYCSEGGKREWAECVWSGSVMREMTTLNWVVGRERKGKVR